MGRMNIYLISQEENDGYDTYDSAVVCAETEDDAKEICPDEYYELVGTKFVTKKRDNIKPKNYDLYLCGTWATDIKNVEVEYIGDSNIVEKGVVLASFNAG